MGMRAAAFDIFQPDFLATSAHRCMADMPTQLTCAPAGRCCIGSEPASHVLMDVMPPQGAMVLSSSPTAADGRRRKCLQASPHRARARFTASRCLRPAKLRYGRYRADRISRRPGAKCPHTGAKMSKCHISLFLRYSVITPNAAQF